MTKPISRRALLRDTAAIGVGCWVVGPGGLHAASPNQKLNIAMVAAGGRGGANLRSVSSENIVALCDVDANRLKQASGRHPDAKTFVDYRKLFDDAKSFDAVVVSAPEQHHAIATLMALKLGKHVYCEKPLTHTVHECRVVDAAAKKAKVATQMGTQIHAGKNFRRVVELVQSGAIGQVSEVHVWVSRAWGGGDRPAGEDPVPAHLNWDLWLGPAPVRPFNKAYYPGPKWYRYWDFGSGTMSDLGSHWNDLAFWALKLDSPKTIVGDGPPPNKETAPASMSATYTYGARGKMGPVTHTWYQGKMKPKLHTEKKIPQWGNGVLFVGEKGMILSDYGKHVLLPEEKFKDFERPKPFIPDSPGHHQEWIRAAKTGSPTGSPFDYAAALTIANHLGNVAYRTGKKITWDPVAFKTDCAEANKLIDKEYRKGWELPA